MIPPQGDIRPLGRYCMVNNDPDFEAPLISRELAAWANREDGDEDDLVRVSIRAEVAALLKRVAGVAALLQPVVGSDPDALMNSHEVAALLKVSDRTVERKRATGNGPAYVAMDGVIRYVRRDVLAYIQRNRRCSTSDANPRSELEEPIERRSGRRGGVEVRTEPSQTELGVAKREAARATDWLPGRRLSPRRGRRPRTSPPHPPGAATKKTADGANTCKNDGSKADGPDELAPQEPGRSGATLPAVNRHPLKRETPNNKESAGLADQLGRATTRGTPNVAGP
jgi:hypothetical protein